MPIKVVCSSCKAGLNAPDKLRGKSVRCPKCKAPMKIPTGTPQRKSKPKPKSSAASDEDFLAKVDLSRVQQEDTEDFICPKCATPIAEEEKHCSKCGFNPDVGAYDQAFLKRKNRQGADPAEFYSVALKESLEFTKNNKLLIWRTAQVWSVFGALTAICGFMGFSFVERLPPKIFWMSSTVLSLCAIAGWFWFLCNYVVKMSMLREKKIKRFSVDYFDALALGVKALLWPILMGFPIFLPMLFLSIFVGGAFAVGTGSGETGASAMGIVILGTYVGLYLTFPIAQAHLAARYTYKAAILWELVKLVPKNIGPVLFWNAVALGLALPFLGLALILQFFGGGFNPCSNTYLLSMTDWTTQWLGELMFGRPLNDEGLFYKGLFGLQIGLFCFPYFAFMAIPAAFPGVFMARFTGQFAYYNKENLDLVNTIAPFTPATFWVRFLAWTTDQICVPFAGFLVLKDKVAVMVAQALNAGWIACVIYLPAMLPFYGLLWGLYTNWMYFAISEASKMRTTIGKDAYGLIVVDEENKELTRGRATYRFFGRFFGHMILIAPLFAAIDPQKRTLYDMTTKTRVVWKGDE